MILLLRYVYYGEFSDEYLFFFGKSVAPISRKVRKELR